MIGTPKVLQTRADVEFAVGAARAGEMSARGVALLLAGLVTAAHHYVFDRDLAADEPLDGASPEYALEEQADPEPRRRQLRRAIDPGARLLAMGYTIPEIESLITELEAL